MWLWLYCTCLAAPNVGRCLLPLRRRALSSPVWCGRHSHGHSSANAGDGAHVLRTAPTIRFMRDAPFCTASQMPNDGVRRSDQGKSQTLAVAAIPTHADCSAHSNHPSDPAPPLRCLRRHRRRRPFHRRRHYRPAHS